MNVIVVLAACTLIACTQGGDIPQFIASSHEEAAPSLSPAVNDELARQAGLEKVIFRVGPIDLPAYTGPDPLLEKPLVMRFQLDHPMWIIGFIPRVVDALGNELPAELLHHGLLVNMHEANPLCTSGASGNPFAAATGLLTTVMLPEGHGYPLLPTDPIEARVVLQNPTERTHHEVFFEITLLAKPLNEFTALRDVTTILIEPEPCRHTTTAIPPEDFYEQTATAQLTKGGDLVFAIGLMDDYAASLTLTKQGKLEALWTMSAKLDEAHRLMELVNNPFEDPAGLSIADGETLLLKMFYDNVSGEWLSDAFSGALLFVTPSPPP